MAADVYELDFYEWTKAQAEALRAEARRAGRSNAIEWERVAEEIEDMGKSDLRECYARVRTILEHLFKLAWSERQEPRRSWEATILVHRSDLEPVLTASLRAQVEQELDDLHRRAAKLAERTFLDHEPSERVDASLRWSLPQILGEADDPIEG